MKNLPCYISLAAIASLVLAAAASSLGLPVSFMDAASVIVGLACAAGVIALFLVDYGPRPSYDRAAVSTPEVNRAVAPAAPVAASRRHLILRNKRPAAGSATRGAMAAMALVNDPATLSIL